MHPNREVLVLFWWFWQKECWRNFVKNIVLYCTFRTFRAFQKNLQSTPCNKRAQWSDTGPIKLQPFSMSNTYDWSCICGWEVTNNCHEENLRKEFSRFFILRIYKWRIFRLSRRSWYSSLRIWCKPSLTVMLSIADMPRVIFSPESLGIMKTNKEITWKVFRLVWTMLNTYINQNGR